MSWGCSVPFTFVWLTASFQNRKIEEHRDGIKTPRRMGKWNLSHLKKSPVYSVTVWKHKHLWGKLEKWESPTPPPPSRSKRHSLILQFPSNRKVPHPLKKYCIISVYWHLLLSKIQPQPSPFSPSSLILPTRLSQSFEHNRLTTLLSHHQFL